MRGVILILVCMFFVLDVEALSVASDFIKNKTMHLTEGTSTIYSIRLQNPYSYETRVKVDYNKELMKGLNFEEEYTLPPDSSTRLEFNITAPEYKKNNDLFIVSFTVHQLSGGGGGIGFLTKINKNFKLKVDKKPSFLDKINFLYVSFSIILIIILIFLYKKKKPKQKTN